MQDNSSELLSQAITKIRTKNQPKSSIQPSSFVPEDAHKQLFPLLEIWSEETQDPDVDEKVKFIHQFLTDEQGTARDKIMHILGELPAISNESTLQRIYKHCKLKNEYRSLITRAEKLNQRIKAI